MHYAFLTTVRRRRPKNRDNNHTPFFDIVNRQSCEEGASLPRGAKPPKNYKGKRIFKKFCCIPHPLPNTPPLTIILNTDWKSFPSKRFCTKSELLFSICVPSAAFHGVHANFRRKKYACRMLSRLFKEQS